MAKRNSEIKELENAFQRLSGKRRKPKGKYAKTGVFAALLFSPVALAACALALIAVIACGIFAFFTIYNNQVISANVSIVGVDVSNMTRKEAQSAVTEAFEKRFREQSLFVTVDGTTLEIPYSASQATIDARGAVADALAAKKTGHTVTALDVSKHIDIDKTDVADILYDFQPLLNSSLRQTQCKVEGNAPAYINEQDPSATQCLVITKGTRGTHFDINDLMKAVLKGYSDALVNITYAYPITEPDPVDWDALLDAYCIEPVEAEMDKETFEISGGTYGYGFSPEQAQAALDAMDYGQSVKLPFQWISPKVTAAQLGEVLFRDELATYTTVAGSQYGRNINLRLAAEAVNGTILYPGEVFSFNGTLGERTPEKGYQPAASYVGGLTVMDYGGGICQVATTIYYCAVVSDLEIVERECHGYASSYTPLSTDATVFWNGIDFRFRNNSDYPLRIDASSNGGNVTVSLVGTDTKDYYVKFESVFLEEYAFETEYKELPPDNEEGYEDGHVLIDPYRGYRSESYRVKYDKQTHEMIERTLECRDRYSTRNKLVVKIVTEETEPDPTDPEITEPDPTVTKPPVTEPPVSEPAPSDPVQTEPPVSTEPPAADPPAGEGTE